MSRKDYIKKCFECAVHLLESCVDENQINVIVQRTEEMVNLAWKFEYKEYKQECGCKKHPQMLMKCFWDSINTEMECEQKVYKFAAYFDETVNPPGQEGNVKVYIQPNRCIRYLTFKLRI